MRPLPPAPQKKGPGVWIGLGVVVVLMISVVWFVRSRIVGRTEPSDDPGRDWSAYTSSDSSFPVKISVYTYKQYLDNGKLTLDGKEFPRAQYGGWDVSLGPEDIPVGATEVELKLETEYKGKHYESKKKVSIHRPIALLTVTVTGDPKTPKTIACGTGAATWADDGMTIRFQSESKSAFTVNGRDPLKVGREWEVKMSPEDVMASFSDTNRPGDFQLQLASKDKVYDPTSVRCEADDVAERMMTAAVGKGIPAKTPAGGKTYLLGATGGQHSSLVGAVKGADVTRLALVTTTNADTTCGPYQLVETGRVITFTISNHTDRITVYDRFTGKKITEKIFRPAAAGCPESFMSTDGVSNDRVNDPDHDAEVAWLQGL